MREILKQERERKRELPTKIRDKLMSEKKVMTKNRERIEEGQTLNQEGKREKFREESDARKNGMRMWRGQIIRMA